LIFALNYLFFAHYFIVSYFLFAFSLALIIAVLGCCIGGMSLVLPPQAMLPGHNSSDTDRIADAATSPTLEGSTETFPSIFCSVASESVPE